MGHLFLWIVAVILFLGDVGDSPRQWRRECGLEGAEKGEWCAIGLLYELLKTNPTTSSRGCRVCPT